MNWKEHPHLFANGEFYMKSKETSEPDDEFILSGYAQVISGKGWSDEVYFTKEGYNAVVESCKLIARPIKDMTDEEREQVWRTFDDGDETWKEHRSNYEDYVSAVAPPDIPSHSSTEIEEMTGIIQGYTPATLEALNLGVYPFSDTEDVIFKPKQS